MINERFVNRLVIALYVLTFALATLRVSATSTGLISGWVDTNKAEVSFSLPEGDYLISILHEDAETFTIVEVKARGKYQKIEIDNQQKESFARLVLCNDKGEILFRVKLIEEIN